MYALINHALLPGLFFGIIIVILFARYIIRKRERALSLLVNVSPATTVFAFDLHGVILTPNFREIMRIIWCEFPKIDFFRFLSHPFGLYYAIKFVKNEAVTEQVFDEFCERYPKLTHLKPLFVKLIAAQWLTKKSVEALKLLRKKGYYTFILSNIWPSAFELLVQKYPILLELFNGVYLPAPENNYVHKPQRAFYGGFKRYLKERGFEQRQIVFIDNTAKNIEKAKEAGLQAFQVSNLNKLITKIKNVKSI